MRNEITLTDEQIEQTTIWETKVTETMGLKFKIQMRQVLGVWQQRHIWYPTDRASDEPKHIEKWIKGIQSAPNARTYKAVDIREAPQ